MEQALMGTPIQDPDQPIEALRVIHSFDPCLSCAVHVIRGGEEVRRIQTGDLPVPA
jgi:Ni,Fe-hydrogenase I large subunit